MDAENKVFEEYRVERVFRETENEKENEKDELRNMAT